MSQRRSEYRRARHLRGMTMSEAAKRLGLSQSMLSRYERGLAVMNVELLQNMARLYATGFTVTARGGVVCSLTVALMSDARDTLGHARA
jgi:transcriptional regulator with XRE-family HTH domain